MDSLVNLIRTHGSLVVLGVAFLENLGLPIPALPFLVIAGCLVVDGPVSLPLTILAAIVGALSADLLWFWFGLSKGRSALQLFCKLSLNPDSCVGRTERIFRARGALTILTSKLIPGLNTLVPPLAGVLRMSFWKYVLLDIGGSTLWACLGVGLGMVFGVGVLSGLESIQNTLVVLLVGLITAYIISKVFYRRHLVKHYSVPKIDPAELYEMISTGKEVLVIDLRNENAFLSSAAAVPGSMRIPPAEFEIHVHRLPKEKEIILYCT